MANEAIYLRDEGNLSAAEIARATGATTSTASAWMRGKQTPRPDRAERLGELREIVMRLRSVVNPEFIPKWLDTRIAALGGKKPIELIAEGEYRRVAAVVSELESPTFD